MKRAALVDRVRLLAEKRHALMLAAGEARKEATEYWRREAEAKLEAAALAYAVVAIRYLGGNQS